MSRPRVAFLNAAHEVEDTVRNFRRELDAELVEFRVQQGEFPDSFSAGDTAESGVGGVSGGGATGGSSSEHREFDGVVVSGSKSSVYWGDDWIPHLVECVADAHDAGLPVLGVCFGHQVLAEALGGTAENMGAFEIGYREIEQVADDPIFDGIPETFVAFTTHGDTVTELPPDATLLAENDYGVHGFRVEQSVGVQFHPEYDVETAEAVAHEKDIDEDRREDVLAGINEENYEKACETKQLFENYTSSLAAHPTAD